MSQRQSDRGSEMSQLPANCQTDQGDRHRRQQAMSHRPMREAVLNPVANGKTDLPDRGSGGVNVRQLGTDDRQP